MGLAVQSAKPATSVARFYPTSNRKVVCMRLISWNVNGIRSVLKKGFLEFVAEQNPHVLCLQEVRATPEQVKLEVPGYEVHWYPAERKGYSGTAILTRETVRDVRRGLGRTELDTEGRVLTIELSDCYVVNVYTPNAQRELTRLAYRTQQWDPAFRQHVSGLARKKPVVFCGDLNVAHQEIDLANPRGNERNAGFTIEERESFGRLLDAGFVDTFREFTDSGGHYTWWSNFGRAREKNIGWRIDYFCVSAELRERLQSSIILPDVMGSDHCPIVMELA